MRVLVTIMAPIYWSLAQARGAAQNGLLLTQGTFQHESLLHFATGEGSLTAQRAQLSLHLPHADPQWSSVCVGGCCGC